MGDTVLWIVCHNAYNTNNICDVYTGHLSQNLEKGDFYCLKLTDRAVRWHEAGVGRHFWVTIIKIALYLEIVTNGDFVKYWRTKHFLDDNNNGSLESSIFYSRSTFETRKSLQRQSFARLLFCKIPFKIKFRSHESQRTANNGASIAPHAQQMEFSFFSCSSFLQTSMQ